jgi:hypothetical protein
MRRFETQTLETTDAEVARLLIGMDSRTLELAQDEQAYRRMVAFHEYVYDEARPVAIEQPDGSANLYGHQCMSAISLGGQLIGARHRQTTSGEKVTGAYYAVATASLYEDEPLQWREAPHRYSGADKSLELTIDGTTDFRPSLSLVGTAQTPYERAIVEAARQEEQERLRLTTTRVLLGRSAWSLLKPGYVVEPLQGTYSLMNTVAYARLRGFTSQAQAEEASADHADIIDNYN